MGRRRLAMFSSVLALVLTALVPSAPAAADEHLQKTFNEAYSQSGVIRLNTPSICVARTFNGVMSYRGHWIHRTPATGQDSYAYLIDNVKLSTNSLTLRGFKPDGSTCPNAATKRWNAINVEAHARGHNCGFNPSLSASLGFPASFGLGLEVWPDCSDKAKTFLKASAGEGTSTTLRNDPQVVTFEGQDFSYANPNTNVPWKCYAVNFGFQINVGPQQNINTAVGPKVASCPNWKGSKAAF